MNNLQTLKWQVYPVRSRMQVKKVIVNRRSNKSKYILFGFSLIIAFILGRLVVRGINIGNITRCQNYRQSIAANPKVFITVDVRTVQMCSSYGVSLK